MSVLKSKSVTLVWEFMFMRSMYQTEDIAEQGKLLNEISRLIDNNTLINTCKDIVQSINAKNLRNAHQRLESGKTIDKIVLAGWD